MTPDPEPASHRGAWLLERCAARALAGNEAAMSLMETFAKSAERLGGQHIIDDYRAKLRRRFN
ncbi:hypothetical protein DSM21852_37650 [Methylocystis bryophila]|nr:hypothetical protein DSM21852_37650 [Methylocystis bryophila]